MAGVNSVYYLLLYVNFVCKFFIFNNSSYIYINKSRGHFLNFRNIGSLLF